MVKIKLKASINFDGKVRNSGEEIETTKERFKEMQSNFKKQNLKIENYLDILYIEKEKQQRKSKK